MGQTLKKFQASENVFLISLTIFNLFLRFFRLDSPGFSYFDENKFYLKAANSILQTGVDTVWEHPPLSKLLMALSIHFFGNNFFGWRLFSVLFATLGVVGVYFLAKKIVGGRSVPTLSSLFLTFDFAWFSTGRLAVPEIFLACFLIFSSLFFWYFIKDSEKAKKINWKALSLWAVFFGFALGTKLTALLSLPIFLVVTAYFFRKKIKFLVIILLTFFSLTLLTYLATYSVYLQKNSPSSLVKLHQQIFEYHTQKVKKIVANEPKLAQQQSSYQAIRWPANNIFSFRFEERGDRLKTVLFLYNPLVLWGALVATIIFLFRWLKQKKLKIEMVFLVYSFLIFWLVFIFSPRIVYPYYWLSGIPFGTIILSWFLAEKFKKEKIVLTALVVTAGTLFLLYYPLLTNWPVKLWYFRILTGTIGFY